MNIVRFVPSAILAVIAWAFLRYVAPAPESVWFAIVAGVIAIVVFELGLVASELARDRWLRRPLERVLGRDCFKEGLMLFYTSFRNSKAAAAALSEKNIPFPHVALDDQAETGAFRVDEPVAAHDLRAALYVGELVIRHRAVFQVKNTAKAASDLDLSFVCFGLGGSQKAREVLKELNRYGIGHDEHFRLIYLESQLPVVPPIAGHDVGYIIKLTPHLYPDRTWLLCGGHGGPGTAAAGSFLARRLASIPGMRTTIGGEKIGNRSFLIGLAVEPEADQSAEPQRVLLLQKGFSTSG